MSPQEFEAALGGLINSAAMGGVHPAIISGVMFGKLWQVQETLFNASRPPVPTKPPEDSPIIQLPPGTRLPPDTNGQGIR